MHRRYRAVTEGALVRRWLESWFALVSINDDRDSGSPPTRLLWAAYVDPRYGGNVVKEYEFYDLRTREWDDASCRASGKRQRCARMDCHEKNTHFKLVRVSCDSCVVCRIVRVLLRLPGRS